MKSRGSLRLVTVVMMGMCVFYGAMAFQLPVETKVVDQSTFLVLSILAGLGLLAGVGNALLTSPMLPANMAKTRLMCFVVRMMGSKPLPVLPFFIAPVVAIGLLILPRALASQD